MPSQRMNPLMNTTPNLGPIALGAFQAGNQRRAQTFQMQRIKEQQEAQRQIAIKRIADAQGKREHERRMQFDEFAARTPISRKIFDNKGNVIAEVNLRQGQEIDPQSVEDFKAGRGGLRIIKQGAAGPVQQTEGGGGPLDNLAGIMNLINPGGLFDPAIQGVMDLFSDGVPEIDVGADPSGRIGVNVGGVGASATLPNIPTQPTSFPAVAGSAVPTAAVQQNPLFSTLQPTGLPPVSAATGTLSGDPFVGGFDAATDAIINLLGLNLPRSGDPSLAPRGPAPQGPVPAPIGR